MKVLVIGSGGREHAIVWKLSKSKKITDLYCAPGNGGISEYAKCIDIPSTKTDELATWAKENKIDLTIVGMDDPLMLGIVDVFEEKNLRIFGPRKNAAIIEGSKVFSKDLMKKYKIPTAEYEVFDDYNKAKEYIVKSEFPLVIKADGLAFGKGVLICNRLEEAILAIDEIMINKKFGEAGNRIVVEEFITGPEVSVLSFCDGKNLIPMVSAQDHKRALDNDQGLNTGGMGTFSPSNLYTEELEKQCYEEIFLPSLKAMEKEGRPFTGILFFGLMLTKDGPKLLEYNARFGDPEAQVVLPRLKTDLLDIFEAGIEKKLDEINLEWEDDACVCVILSSGGYPLDYKTGYEIKGLDTLDKDTMIFHSGTIKKDNKYFTNGGRVLGVTGFGKDVNDARKKVYEDILKISFKDMHYRNDIGIK